MSTPSVDWFTRLQAVGKRAWRTHDECHAWFMAPHPALSGRCPTEVMQGTPADHERVMALVMALAGAAVTVEKPAEQSQP